MTAMASLEITAARVALLVDVEQRRVLTDPNTCAAFLELPGEDPADVSAAIWQMEQAGWVREPIDSTVWELTDLGRAVREGGWS